MRLVFLPLTRADLAWMRNYYARIFPDGARQATDRYFGACEALRGRPHVGRPVERMPGVRELLVSRTPFSFLYRVVDDRIEVLRVWDQRGDRAKLRSTEPPGR